MDASSSCYEDADSKVNFNEGQYFYGNGKTNNQNKLIHNNSTNKINNDDNIESSKKINEYKKYNNIPETNIIINNNINNDDSENNSNYSSARQFETKFEKEKNISYCSTCTCIIF